MLPQNPRPAGLRPSQCHHQHYHSASATANVPLQQSLQPRNRWRLLAVCQVTPKRWWGAASDLINSSCATISFNALIPRWWAGDEQHLTEHATESTAVPSTIS